MQPSLYFCIGSHLLVNVCSYKRYIWAHLCLGVCFWMVGSYALLSVCLHRQKFKIVLGAKAQKICYSMSYVIKGSRHTLTLVHIYSCIPNRAQIKSVFPPEVDKKPSGRVYIGSSPSCRKGLFPGTIQFFNFSSQNIIKGDRPLLWTKFRIFLFFTFSCEWTSLQKCVGGNCRRVNILTSLNADTGNLPGQTYLHLCASLYDSWSLWQFGFLVTEEGSIELYTPCLRGIRVKIGFLQFKDGQSL